MATNFIDYILLAVGFIFIFFIPGLFIIDNFFPKIPVRIKFPLCLLLSVLVSTYLVYIISLILGFSRYSILTAFIFFVPWTFVSLRKILDLFASYYKNHRLALSTGIVVFFLFLVSLYPGIFTRHQDYIVMSSVNWQDTAMHTGIIESLTQGNFPPQAPYYAGVPLSYYYFTDFHSAIISTLFGKFFPRILVFDNPFFAFTFFLSVYALSYELTKKKGISVASGFTATLFSNFMFTKFVADVIGNKSQPVLKVMTELLAGNGYSLDYGKLFQVSNMADYFLQNRPMMVGLPAVILVLLLTIYGYKKEYPKLFILAGVVTGLLVKFQFFAVVVALMVFGVGSVFHFRAEKLKFLLKSFFFFIFPFLLFFLIFYTSVKANNSSLIDLVKSNFSLFAWIKGESFIWQAKFILLNFGPTFLLTVSGIIWYLLQKNFKKKEVGADFIFISVFSLVLFLVPLTIKFTVYGGDMFKFFYFMEALNSIIAIWFLDLIIKKKLIFKVVLIIVIFCSTSSSFLTLANSMLNKNSAYLMDDYFAGLWIRQNTPQKSVFITMPTLHTPVDQIGGRLRVLSYINWPYSHGYNIGEDNVFKRRSDIQSLYKYSDQADLTKKITDTYGANYVYLGEDEKGSYPEAERNFNGNNSLIKVYENDTDEIYKVR